jgi:hypothetical protein
MRFKITLQAAVVLTLAVATSSAFALSIPLGTLPDTYNTNPAPGGTIQVPNTFTFTIVGGTAVDFTLSSTITIPTVAGSIDLTSSGIEILNSSNAEIFEGLYTKSSQGGSWGAEIDDALLQPGSYSVTTFTNESAAADANRLSIGYSLSTSPADPPPVPERSTWTMMLLGFACLGYAGYRRTRGAVSIAA